jgi:hypothetical protein
MKKWMMIALLGALTAGLAVAEETKVPWYKKMFGKSADEQTQVIPPAPATPAPAPAPEMPRMKMGEHQRPQLTPEQREKMKAHHEEVMKLGEAIRNETDPAKKEALTADLRTKVTAMVDRMLAEQAKRIEQAEKELPKLKERLAESQKNKAARIEEHVQRIISGEMPKGPDGERPRLEKFRKEFKKGEQPPPPVE